MSDPTKEVVNADVVQSPAAQEPKFKMSIGDTVNTLKAYQEQAEKSLSQLQSNIDNAEKQVAEFKRIQLMIMGQKQLLVDLINKTVDNTPSK